METQGKWRLDDCKIIRAQGPEAIHFLHGQLTNAVQGLPSNQARPSGYCTAQGRLLANGVFWADPEHDILFLVSADLAESLLQRLRMFVLRSQVKLSLDANLQIQGVMGHKHLPKTLLDLPAWSMLHLPEETWIMAPTKADDQAAAWCIRAKNSNSDMVPTADGWRAFMLACGWPLIRTGTQDTFLPTALNMDLNGSIDFKKGCYPGQEIIARSHYRGTVKRRMAYGTAIWEPGTSALPQAADLYPAKEVDSRPTGRIIESVVHQGILHVAAEITLTDWPDMRYAAGAPDGPVLDLTTAI